MKLRCISPHGGGRNGLDRNGNAVGPGYSGPLEHPPNPGGYVITPGLGTVAVGDVVDAPDDFNFSPFHFERADPPPAPPASAGSLSDLLSKGDS